MATVAVKREIMITLSEEEAIALTAVLYRVGNSIVPSLYYTLNDALLRGYPATAELVKEFAKGLTGYIKLCNLEDPDEESQ